jgi:hypothetical protein
MVLQRWLAALLVALCAAGCAKKATNAAPDVHGESAKPGSALAYEHRVSISMAGDAIPARMDAVREACAEGKHGSCSLLRFEQGSGSHPTGLLELRVVPEGVAPLVTMASEGARIGSRETRAEDLTQAVADTGRQTEQLQAQRAKLVEISARKDLSVSDLLTITREVSTIDAQLAELRRTSEGQQRRIETNLLTLNFSGSERGSRWSTLGDAVDGFLDTLVEGLSGLLEFLAYGIPFLLVAFPLALLWRKLWRWATRATR